MGNSNRQFGSLAVLVRSKHIGEGLRRKMAEAYAEGAAEVFTRRAWEDNGAAKE